MSNPDVGEPAPDFTLETDDGATFQLSAQRGKKVVLFFYPQDDTEGCTIENLEFTQLAPAFKAASVVLLGISPDTLSAHQKFREKFSLAVPLAADPDHIAIDAYGVWGEKINFGKKYMGLIRSTFLIDAEGRIAEHWKVTRIKGHAAKVLERVSNLR